jgi:hypothetical protein
VSIKLTSFTPQVKVFPNWGIFLLSAKIPSVVELSMEKIRSFRDIILNDVGSENQFDFSNKGDIPRIGSFALLLRNRF